MASPDLLQRFYADLLAHFGHRHWWPGETPWEIAAGAVLVQNTNWANVERALAGLQQAGELDPERIVALAPAALADLIRPAGCHRVKAQRLAALAAWWLAHAAAAAAGAVPTPRLRESLLAVHGVGPETADSILLYAFGRTTFVVDAYARRFLARHGLQAAGASYGQVQEFFTRRLPADAALFNDYHAQLVELGKQYCRPVPRCEACPLAWHDHAPPGARA